MTRILNLLMFVMVATWLSACGGGGGSAGTPSGSASPANFSVNVPSTVTLAVGQKVSYKISGGTAPYKVAVDSPNLVYAEVKGSVVEVTTLKVGVARVNVTTSDVVSAAIPSIPLVSFSVNISASASSLTVQTPAGIVSLSTGVSASYFVSGGSGPFTALTNNPGVASAEIAGSSLNIKTQRPGKATVSVVDAMGSRVDIDIDVAVAATFSTSAPSTVRLARGATAEYSISGGIAPYSVTAPEDATVLDVVLNGSKFSLVGKKGGTVTVKVRDSGGGEQTITVTVTSGTLSLDAGNAIRATLASSSSFGIVGGRPPYVAASQAPGIVTASVSGSSLTLSVFNPSGGGTYPNQVLVRLSDAEGTVADITVELYSLSSAVDFFTNAGTNVVVPVNITSSYDVGGGKPAYTVGNSNPQIARATVSSSQLSITGLVAGTTSLILTDSAGTKLPAINVRVGPSDDLYTTAPSTVSMQGAQTRVFAVGGGRPDYSAVSSDTSVATAQINGNSLSIASVGNGSAEIRVTDAAGTRLPAIAVNVTQAASAAVGTIDLLTDMAQIRSAGEQAVVTAVVKNAGNVGMANQNVVFTASSGVLLSPSAATDASGVATVRLSAGSDKSNRTIRVNATVGAVTRTVEVFVVGTQVTVSGPTSRQLTTPSNKAMYTVRLQDSGGSAISGALLGLTSSLGNPLTNSVGSPVTSVTTNSNGTATFMHEAVTAGVTGIDVLTADFSDEKGIATVNISPIDFTVVSPTVVSPATSTNVNIDTDQLIRVQFRENNAPGTGNISFSTSRGTLGAAPGFPLTSGNVAVVGGIAEVLVRSPSAGAATVTAQVPGVGNSTPRAQVSVPIQFVATTPRSLVLQSNLGAIPPNPAGSATNVADIEATVRDENANPVANVQVSFVLAADPSNGSLQSAIGVTDNNGKVKAQFVAGPNSTANNGVKVTAQVVSDPTVAGDVFLTVNGNSLFITIGFGNNISNNNGDLTTYSKPFTVYVTDANGVPVGNQDVTISVIPENYKKGTFSWRAPLWQMTPTFNIGANVIPDSPTFVCPNEDVNANGVLELNGVPAGNGDGDGTGLPAKGTPSAPGYEDQNDNRKLDPGNIAVASPGTLRTDTAGRASFNLLYGEQFAYWSDVKIVARATVAGTESRKELIFTLSGMGSDYEAEAVPPAGVVSPFGRGYIRSSGLARGCSYSVEYEFANP